jgi:hypothetical protein
MGFNSEVKGLMKLEFSEQIFTKYPNIKSYDENPYIGSRVVPCGRRDRQADTMKLTVAFRNFANAPKKRMTACI